MNVGEELLPCFKIFLNLIFSLSTSVCVCTRAHVHMWHAVVFVSVLIYMDTHCGYTPMYMHVPVEINVSYTW